MSLDGSLNYASFKLPASLVVKSDVARLVNEAERVDSELTTERIHKKADAKQQAEPLPSPILDEFLQYNDLKFDDDKSRRLIIKQLRALKNNIPIIHMTFAVTADQESLRKVVAWLRESVHPQAVIAVGLQPALVAGVYMRTPNHVHDLSLRALLKGQHDTLVGELKSLSEGVKNV